MKTTNANQPGERSHGVTRGHIGSARAGTPGPTFRDDAGTEATNSDIQVSGATVVDSDGTTFLLIDGAGGTTDVTSPTYGAVGDGVTDDTAAINLAIAAINTAGCGVLYFPCGTYLVSGALTAITASCTVMGDGMAAWDLTTGISEIVCSSQTAVLFTVTGVEGSFQNIALRNTFAGTPSSASRGIQQTPTTGLEKWDFQNVSVRGFYNNIDIGGGVGWSMHNCWIYGPVNYGVRVRNTVIMDGGDWVISNTGVFSANYNAAAGIRIESSGGGKIIGCKINKGTDSPEKRFVYGVELNAANTIITSILLISGTSIENPSSHCVYASSTGTGTWPYITITGCQMAPYNSTGSAVTINAAALGDLDHVMIAGCQFATLIGATTCAVTLTNVYDAHVYVASIEFGGGVVCATGSLDVRDISAIDGDSGPTSLIVDDGTTAPILDSGSGDYIYA